MDIKTLNKIKRKVTQENGKVSDYYAYDDMDDCRWELPSGFSQHDWIRKRVSTVGHDMLKSATNTFDAYLPRFNIQPRGYGDTENAERLERGLEWMMLRASQNGVTEPFRKMIKSAVKYNKIAVQLDYLPYTDPDRKDYASNFCINYHLPHDVYYQSGKYGLEWVCSISVQCADDVIGHWQAFAQIKDDKGKKVKSALSKLEAEYNDEAEEESYVLVIDYTDKKKREVLCIELDGDSWTADNLDVSNAIIIVDDENKKGFIPWAIGEGATDPLLAPLLKGGLWENQNFLDTMLDSSAIKRGWYPLGVHQSPTGQNLLIDFTGHEAVIEAKPGESFQQLIPPPLDPGLSQLAQKNASQMGQSVSIQNLGQVNPVNVQAAVFQNLIQVQLTELEPYKRTFDKVGADLAKLFFLWIDFADASEKTWRPADKDMMSLQGEEISISKGDFNPDELYITCDLQPNQYTDKLQKINGITMMKSAGIPYDDVEALETIGVKNPEAVIGRWKKQEIQRAQLEAFKTEILGEAQAKVQAMMAQVQMQLQQAQMAQQQPQQQPQQAPPDQGFPEGQGFAPPQGGISPMEANPNMTQTQVQGMAGQ